MYLTICCFFLCWAPALTLKNLNYSVPEEQGAGTVIGNIGRDARLAAGATGAPHLLDVDGESGLLYTKQRIDREALCRRSTKCQLSLEVFANDQEICMIKVDMDISENAAPGTRFPLTSAHDPDAGDNGLRTYLLTRDDYGLFSLDVKSRALDASYVVELPENAPLGTAVIDLNATDADEGTNGESGLIRVKGNLDYEESGLIEIDVQARDLGPNPIPAHCKGALSKNGQLQCRVLGGGGGPGAVPFTLEENYDNFYTVVTDRPLDREAQDEYNVPENNIPGEYLGSVLAQDPDLGQNGTVSYSILPGHVGDTKHFEFRVLAKDSGSPHRESNATVPRNAGVGYPVGTVRALDSDFGESGRLTYEIVEGNEEHLFEMDPTSGEIRTLHPYWEELSPVAELVVKVSDHGKPSLSAVAKLIVRALAGPLPEAGEPQVNGEQHRRPHWDLSLPLIVTLSTVSIILLAAMITIAVKCKRENKEIRTYNCRIAEYSHPQLGGGGGSGGGGGGSGSGGGKGKKKKISKNDIMLVPSEGEDSRGPLNVMNVVSSPSLATSPMYFDYQTRLPLSSPRSEVMYLKPASNNLTVPQGHVGCHTSFTGQGTNASEAPPSRMSIIQTDNFPAEPNYMGSRQQFVQSSSTFKDPERASLRDSGHGDSDQADSDQDTNKGSCCDMSVREALKMKTTSTKSQPLEQVFHYKNENMMCGQEARGKMYILVDPYHIMILDVTMEELMVGFVLQISVYR
ncbi:hypothetical protein ASZ78_005892 [Callipepla squamata]|uniref:Cadherin domain-containing protein n=1 Tax=Callipepla squamata TaxID=9009 RepID=A0A226MW97_CALSU|nr:hypothetical protein ASZ78_005892 [Callipepla squamata]